MDLPGLGFGRDRDGVLGRVDRLGLYRAALLDVAVPGAALLDVHGVIRDHGGLVLPSRERLITLAAGPVD